MKVIFGIGHSLRWDEKFGRTFIRFIAVEFRKSVAETKSRFMTLPDWQQAPESTR